MTAVNGHKLQLLEKIFNLSSDDMSVIAWKFVIVIS